jgi:uncharacterized membrane protein YphA (DoxX/SURF4 family)
MRIRQTLALNVAPIPIRIALAAVFIYAGWGKLYYKDMPVVGESAATLANLGLLEAPAPAPDGPALDGPAPEEPAPSQPPDTEPDADPPAPEEAAPDAAPEAPEAPEAPGDGTALAPTRPTVIFAQAETIVEARYSPEDFPEPVNVSRRLGLVLMMAGASQQGNWPEQLSGGMALNALAWMAALTEFVGGWLVLLGFLTRVWALGMASAMGVALWLTQIAPAMGANDAFLGVLPALALDDPANWTKAWQLMFYQFTLLCSSLGLVLLGPGGLSLDALLLGPKASSIGENQKRKRDAEMI